MANLSGKVVLITGAAGGFGKTFVKAFLEKGCKVCVGDVNAELGNKTVEEFSVDFGADNVRFCLLDVTSDESFVAAFKTCQETLGSVNILVNNAGIGDEQNWKMMMDVNLGGTIRGTELALENMSKGKGHEGGQVINIASISGIKVVPFGPFYSASKSGIIQYTRAAGHPFHYSYTGVGIQCLCPSLVDTPLLKESPRNPYSPQSGEAIKKLVSAFPIMECGEIIKGFWQLLEENKPGSVMVVEKSKDPYYVDPQIS